MGAVTFNFATFTARYPEFAGLSSDQAQAYFDEAGLYCENNTCNPAFARGILPQLLNMLTAHIAWLNAPRDANGNPSSAGEPAAPLVGRINTASEGSVSVGAEWKGSGSPSEDWFTQTKYGAAYWQASSQFRTALYAPNPTLVAGAIFPVYPGSPSFWRR